MPNRIKADSASGLQLISDSSDEIQIQSGTDTVATINSSGITMGSGKNLVTDTPAFSAYLSSDQSVSNATWTKIQYDTEEFDTNSNYDNATNYRFTPSVAGYYQINATNYVAVTEKTVHMSIYKNGSTFKRGVRFYADNDGGVASLQSIVSAIVYLNGSTDYVEIYGLQSSGSSKNISGDQSLTYFQAVFVRA